MTRRLRVPSAARSLQEDYSLLLARPRLLGIAALPVLQVALPEVLASKAVCLNCGLPRPRNVYRTNADSDYHITHERIGKDGLVYLHLSGS